jgi:hypothetical protein
MSRVTRIAIAGAAVAAAICAATSAGTSTAANRVLAFKTVTHGTVPFNLPSLPSRDASALVVNRVIDAPGQGTQVDFRKYFAVYATMVRPTSGYSLTIRQILLQRFGGYRQICAIAVIGRPSGAVTQEKSMSAHYVKIKRGGLGLNVPDHIVLREQRAGVLAATPGSRTAACAGPRR